MHITNYKFFRTAVAPLTFITEHGRLDVNESVIYDDSWRMTFVKKEKTSGVFSANHRAAEVETRESQQKKSIYTMPSRSPLSFLGFRSI